MVDPLPEDFDDNPRWTAADFAHAKPADDVVSPEILALLVREQRDWEEVTLQLDKAVIDKFRATGPGWQVRINDVLRAADLSGDIRSNAA